ncbi:hypothetical protein LTR10_011918 [Elasticomyces elasticus]|nr:hypothetical protein LTR10_011918 [Elasticomyces elasticus]
MADPRTPQQQAARIESSSSSAQVEQGTSHKRNADEGEGVAKKRKTRDASDSGDDSEVDQVQRARKRGRAKGRSIQDKSTQVQAAHGTIESVVFPAPVEDAASVEDRRIEASSKSVEELESVSQPKAQEDGRVEELSKQVTEQTKTIAELEHALNQVKNQLVQISTERDEAKIERDEASIEWDQASVERDQMKSLTGVFTNIINELAKPKVVVKPIKGSKPVNDSSVQQHTGPANRNRPCCVQRDHANGVQTPAQLAKLKQPLIGKSA